MSKSQAEINENKMVCQCWCQGKLFQSQHPNYKRCSACGTLVAINQLNSDKLNNLYNFDYYWHTVQVEHCGYPPIEQRAKADFNDRIPVWYNLLKELTPNVMSILEIGCAHGGFLSYCKDHGIETVDGIEVDPKTCAFAQEKFGLTGIYSGLFPDVVLPERKYDAIVGFDVLEHFTNPVQCIHRILELLKENGICILQTPWYREENESWRHFLPGQHLYLYTQYSIARLLEFSGVKLYEIRNGRSSDDMFVIWKK